MAAAVLGHQMHGNRDSSGMWIISIGVGSSTVMCRRCLMVVFKFSSACVRWRLSSGLGRITDYGEDDRYFGEPRDNTKRAPCARIAEGEGMGSGHPVRIT